MLYLIKRISQCFMNIDRLSRLFAIPESLGPSDGSKLFSFYLFVAEFTYIKKI